MNSKLYDKRYRLPDDILTYIRKAIMQYPNAEGMDRALFLIRNEIVSYPELERLKNFFSKFDANKDDISSYHLSGGDLMNRFVNFKLDTDRNRAKKHSKAVNSVNDKLTNNIHAQKPISNLDESIGDESNDTKEVSIAIIFDSNDHVLLVKRSDNDQWEPGKWALVGGGIEPNETPQDAIKREVMEEVGLTIDDFIYRFTMTKPSINEHIFVVKKPISIGDIKLNNEHSQAAFFSKDAVEQLMTVPVLMEYITLAITKYS